MHDDHAMERVTLVNSVFSFSFLPSFQNHACILLTSTPSEMATAVRRPSFFRFRAAALSSILAAARLMFT